MLDTPGLAPRDVAKGIARAPGTPVPELSDERLAHAVAHLRAMTPPWRVAVPADVVGGVPTLVAVGARPTMYGEVAAALDERGARVIVVPGSGHRPQDAEPFAAALAEHWAVAERGQ